MDQRWRRWALACVFVAVALAPAWGQDAATTPPLSLSQAVRLALQHNPKLAAAVASVEAAQARTVAARASWLPRVDFSEGVTRSNNPVFVFGTLLSQQQFTQADFAPHSLNQPNPRSNFSTRLDGSWMLFDSGRAQWQQRATRSAAASEDALAQQEAQDLTLRVIAAYYQVAVARQDADAANLAVKTAEASLKDVRDREEAGLVVSADRLSAQVLVAQMTDRAIRAGHDVELAGLTLANEMGAGAVPLLDFPGDLGAPSSQAPDASEYEREANEHRPWLKAMRDGTLSAGDQAKAARSAFGPRVSSFAGWERDAAHLASGPDGSNWIAGARVELNLFAGGADRARLAEAKAQERSAQKQAEWVQSSVHLQVRQACLRLQDAAERSAAQKEAVNQAQESLRIVQNRYTAGLTTITELLRAQSAYLDIQTSYLSSLYDWQVARATLAWSAGLLTPDSPLLNQPEKP